MSPPTSPASHSLQPPFPPSATAPNPNPPSQHQHAVESLVNAAAQHVAPTCPPTSDESPQLADQATNSPDDSLISNRQVPEQEQAETAIMPGTPLHEMEPANDAQTVQFSSSSPASTREYQAETTTRLNEPLTPSRAPSTASSQIDDWRRPDFGASRDIGSVSSFLVQSRFCIFCMAVRCEAPFPTDDAHVSPYPYKPCEGSDPFHICC